MKTIVHNHGFLLFTLSQNHCNSYHKLCLREHPAAKFCTKLFISSENSWNVFDVVMFACESTINASGFIVGVGDGKGSNGFNNCGLLLWYISCFFAKLSGKPVIIVVKNKTPFNHAHKCVNKEFEIAFLGSQFEIS